MSLRIRPRFKRLPTYIVMLIVWAKPHLWHCTGHCLLLRSPYSVATSLNGRLQSLRSDCGAQWGRNGSATTGYHAQLQTWAGYIAHIVVQKARPAQHGLAAGVNAGPDDHEAAHWLCVHHHPPCRYLRRFRNKWKD